MLDLEGKVIIVTGASSGLGEAAARMLAARGAKVVLAARRRDRCEAIVRDVEAAGGTASFCETDVSDGAAVDAMVEHALDRYGRLDGAFNNAGVASGALDAVADMTEETWNHVLGINLTSVWRCMKAEIPAMLANGGGAIVNNSSIYGLRGSEIGGAVYAASKHGVIGLTKSAAMDYAQQGLRINAVCPGFCHSEMVDPFVEEASELMARVIAGNSAMNRLGGADEVAEVVAWLLSGSSSFVNGAAIPIDGGPKAKLY